MTVCNEWFVAASPQNKVGVHRIAVLPQSCEKTRARLAIVHGYGDHAGRYLEFMTWLAERGVSCHAFDLRGQGRSTGRRGFVRHWDQYLDDLQAFLRHPDVARDGAGPLFLLGHSHGGLIVAVAGVRGLLEPLGVAGCILSAPYLINAFRVPWYKSVLARVGNAVWPRLQLRSGLDPELMSSDSAWVEKSRQDPLIVRCATPRWYMGQLAARREALECASRFTLPLLAVQGDSDGIADPSGASEFIANAGSADKSLVMYPGCRHEPLRELGRAQAFADVLNWLENHSISPSVDQHASTQSGHSA